MPNDRLECAPLFWTVNLRATVEKHSRQTMLFQALPFLIMIEGFEGIVTSSAMIKFSHALTKIKKVAETM
jgi:hypothetical protein